MREYSFALGTVASTFALIVAGGLVHATGSALACPDWPLCGGQLVAPMRDGALFQQGHRFAAAAVAALTVALAVNVWRVRRDGVARGLALAAVGLVLGQAALGALAVLLRLPVAISAGHLAVSILLFAVLVVLAHRLRPVGLPRSSPGPRALVGAAAAAAFASIVLGGLVRHGGAALACGTTGLLCRDVLWPGGSGAAQLHMAHRLAAATLAILAVAAALRPARQGLRDRDPIRALLALGAIALVLAQVALGQWTLVSGLSARIATAHLAAAALLLADLLALFLSLGPAAEQRRPSAHRRLAPT